MALFDTLFSYEDKDFGRYQQILKSTVVDRWTYFYIKKCNTFFIQLKLSLEINRNISFVLHIPPRNKIAIAIFLRYMVISYLSKVAGISSIFMKHSENYKGITE